MKMKYLTDIFENVEVVSTNELVGRLLTSAEVEDVVGGTTPGHTQNQSPFSQGPGCSYNQQGGQYNQTC